VLSQLSRPSHRQRTNPGPTRDLSSATRRPFYAYYFGFHQIYLVELTPVELRWRQALRGGAAPLGDVQSIRCAEVSRRGVTVDVATVEFTSRRPLKFGAITPGLTEFLAKIHDTAPQVTVKPPSR
jgi:hypothetical protein